MRRRDVLRGLVAGTLGGGLVPAAWAAGQTEAAAAIGARTLELPPGIETGSGRRLTRASAVTFDPSGERVVAGMESGGNLRVWDAATGQVLNTIQAHRLRIEHLAVSPDGRRVAVAGPGNSIRIDRGLGEAIREVGAAIKVWDLEGRNLAAELEPPDQARALEFQADGSGLLYLRRVGLNRWDLDSGRIDTWPFPNPTSDEVRRGINKQNTAFGARGRHVAAVSSRSDAEPRYQVLTLWDLTSERAQNLDLLDRLGRFLSPIAMSPDGHLLALGTFGGSDVQRVEGRHRLVAILDFATGETLNRKRMPVLEPYCDVLAFSPDGTWLATVSNPSPQKEPDVVRIWNVDTGQEMTAARCPVEHEAGRAQALQSRVQAMTFLPDGRLRVVSGGGLWTPEGTAEHVSILLVVWEIDGPELP